MNNAIGFPNTYKQDSDLSSGKWYRMIEQLGPGWGTPHIKGLGMLVVSLRGVNFGFWSHLGCSGQNAIIFSSESLVQDCTWKNIKICLLSECVLTWSLLGVKKSLGYARMGLFWGFNSKFPTSIPTPFICRIPPPPGNYAQNMTNSIKIVSCPLSSW